jgi:hypothetical protein
MTADGVYPCWTGKDAELPTDRSTESILDVGRFVHLLALVAR